MTKRGRTQSKSPSPARARPRGRWSDSSRRSRSRRGADKAESALSIGNYFFNELKIPKKVGSDWLAEHHAQPVARGSTFVVVNFSPKRLSSAARDSWDLRATYTQEGAPISIEFNGK